MEPMSMSTAAASLTSTGCTSLFARVAESRTAHSRSSFSIPAFRLTHSPSGELSILRGDSAFCVKHRGAEERLTKSGKEEHAWKKLSRLADRWHYCWRACHYRHQGQPLWTGWRHHHRHHRRSRWRAIVVKSRIRNWPGIRSRGYRRPRRFVDLFVICQIGDSKRHPQLAVLIDTGSRVRIFLKAQRCQQ